MTLAFAGVLACVGLMRLGELAWSRARFDRALPEPALFPAMAALHLGLVTLPLAEVLALGREPHIVRGAVAASVLTVALALRVWTLGTLKRAFNVRVVTPPTVVTTGPYRYIRHPNYLVVILEIASLPMLHDAYFSAVLLSAGNLAILSVRIRNEEAVLAELPAWRTAFANRARLVPGLW